MENFFDIATPEEIERHCGYVPDAKDLAERRILCEEDPDGNFSKLAILYHFRGDEAKTHEYLDKIQDRDWRLETSMLMYECITS